MELCKRDRVWDQEPQLGHVDRNARVVLKSSALGSYSLFVLNHFPTTQVGQGYLLYSVQHTRVDSFANS